MLRKWPNISKQICEYAGKVHSNSLNEIGILSKLSNWSQGKLKVCLSCFVHWPYCDHGFAQL